MVALSAILNGMSCTGRNHQKMRRIGCGVDWMMWLAYQWHYVDVLLQHFMSSEIILEKLTLTFYIF